MAFNPDIHHRRSIRLRDYDYRSDGAYFVTLCTYQRECLFGEVVDGEIRLNEYGRIVESIWEELSARYPVIDLDSFVVMPNHVHGIIAIAGNDDVGAIHESPLRESPGSGDNYGANNNGAIRELPLRNRRSMTLPKVIGYFKMNTAKRINALRDNPGCPVWQRNYYEHVIRNETDLTNIRHYIANNPLKWDLDENNPANTGKQPVIIG